MNIADKFASPLRQKVVGENLIFTTHKQPHAAEKMVKHLHGLPISTGRGVQGFDAYATIVVSCDNQTPCTLWTAAPSPQTGDAQHYDSFVANIAREYKSRFSNL